MSDPGGDAAPLAGVRIVEIGSFVAVPLAGMTLAQLGAEVIRVDPIGGGADRHRWPVTADGASIYWTGLNKGVRSVAVDLASAAGQRLVQRLIADAGVLITNATGRQWHSYDTLVADCPGLIHLEVTGRVDGSTGVDYTVNAAVGFPLVTGPPGYGVPINHVLPAWDVACGLYAALGVAAAVRRREVSGVGGRISLALENVALAAAGFLGLLSEPMLTGTERSRIGNAVYGQYGQSFTSSDGAAFMVVTLTARHFRDLAEVTGTSKAVAALAETLGADFADEGQRYRHRAALTELFGSWFAERTADDIAAALGRTSVLWDRYRSFAEVAASERVTANPLFTLLQQPGVGDYLAAGLPLALDGTHPPARRAPDLGADTAAVLRQRLGLGVDEIARFTAAGTIGLP